mgnify:CR=1 FL=1
MGNKFYIDSDIKKAETLPASFYKDEQVFKELKEKIFLKSWHYIGDENLVALPQSVYPLVLLDNYLTEPILIVRNEDDKINCSLEDWDTIFDYYRPNGSSKSWYLRETGKFDYPKTWGVWNLFDIES